MQKVDIQNFTAFISHIEILDLLISGGFVFRGQSIQGNLIPSVARKDPTIDTAKQEKEVIQQLRLMGASFIPDPKTSVLELLVIAQHNGLKTRLLDWTSNPLAALWFACSDPTAEDDIFVYAIDVDSKLLKQVDEIDALDTLTSGFFQPRLSNARITAQHGWFSLHNYSTDQKRFIALESASINTMFLEMRIPGKERSDILSMLSRFGINRRTLFPDLEGLCQHLNWSYRL